MRMDHVAFAAVAAVLATAAQAQSSYSTGFEASEGFVAGTAVAPGANEGNSEWQAAANGSTFGQFTDAAAHSGTQSLAIIRDNVANSGVIHGVRSPELSQGAGEASSGAPFGGFRSSYWIRTGPDSVTTDGALPFFISVNAWSTDRMTWFALEFDGSVLSALASGMDADDNFSDDMIATDLELGAWYQVEQTIRFVNSASGGDDIVSFLLRDADGMQVGSTVTASWDAGYLEPGTFYPNASLSPVNQLNFRTSVDSAGLIAYVDDVSYGAVPEPATWAMMIGGFGLVGAAARRRSAGKVVIA